MLHCFFLEYVFIVAPIPGEMIQFDEYIFSDGLKPPTSYLYIYHEFKPFMEVNSFNTWILWVIFVHPFLQGFVKNGEQVTFCKSMSTGMSLEVCKWFANGLFHLLVLINRIYWGYKPFTNHLLTSWDIHVKVVSFHFLHVFSPIGAVGPLPLSSSGAHVTPLLSG